MLIHLVPRRASALLPVLSVYSTAETVEITGNVVMLERTHAKTNTKASQGFRRYKHLLN
jgi:hypothetical protein